MKFPDGNDRWLAERAGSGRLEEDIKVSSELPLVVAEKYSILRVARVRVNIQRVEVIGHIEHAKGKAQRIFLVDFHVFGNTRVGREKPGITKSVAIRHSHIMAGRIDGRIGEPGVVFTIGAICIFQGSGKKPQARKRSGDRRAVPRTDLVGTTGTEILPGNLLKSLRSPCASL